MREGGWRWRRETFDGGIYSGDTERVTARQWSLGDPTLPPQSGTFGRAGLQPAHSNSDYLHCSPEPPSAPSDTPRTAHTYSMVSAAVLTVSDTAAVNHLLDTSGPAAVQFLTSRGHHVLSSTVVPDDAQLIRQSINAWVRDPSRPIDLIITTGGTGFGARDVTPEVLNPALAVLAFPDH